MTLYGVGLGPGDSGLITVRGRELLESADVVYTPGRLSRSVATEYVPTDRLGDLDFPMTRDEDELRRAWKAAAAEIAPRARGGTAAFVTLGDPNIYSTFGHLRRTLDAFHPEVDLELVPGVSAVTAFTTALGIEIAAGASLTLHEASRGAAPTGPDRMILFKVTDVAETHEGLTDAGYEVTYGRRLYMEDGETVVTSDPADLADRDYYTLAYAEKEGLDSTPATATFETADTPEARTDESADSTQPKPRTDGNGISTRTGETDRSVSPGAAERSDSYLQQSQREIIEMERAIGEACGDELPEVPPR
ncbi:cobalt-factor II C(20)-methyltransferase [Halovenus sp. WSH3]|uniref:Cobalt-factor II C(20)-methyltransferase n=1 Tax=Halovenus carboxidivorans TaxID=2692199 RepID=A0A6B0T175_9EURY|nr:cobalt-factor II C(20)-methyltransferase [Halovenus carboxidivorans]MXR49996.1 cobalt-factor II C(20)-methyltransferase [Halovenus carboxidivorans]